MNCISAFVSRISVKRSRLSCMIERKRDNVPLTRTVVPGFRFVMSRIVRSVAETCSVCSTGVFALDICSEVSRDVEASGSAFEIFEIWMSSVCVFSLSLGSDCKTQTSIVAPLLSSSVMIVRLVISVRATMTPTTLTKRIGWFL